MKKRLTFITLLMLFCSTMFGQNESHWGSVGGYEHTMYYRGIVHIYGENQQSTELEVAAFYNDELRGTAFTQTLGNGCIFEINIGSNINNQKITFKLYDHSSGKVYSTDTELRFNADAVPSGYPVVDFYETHWDSNEIASYYYDMTVLTEIKIDGFLQEDLKLEVAAFCGDQLRGIGRPSYNEKTGKYTTQLRVYGGGDYDDEKPPQETITFKLFKFDGVMESPISTDYTVRFTSGMTMQTPVTVNFYNETIAKIGDACYTSLADAVRAVEKPEDTIKFIKKAEGPGLSINKSVTIDFNNFGYTFTSPAEDTEVGLNILKGEGTANDVTIMNGDFSVSENAGLNMLVQNYADLTIDGVTFNGQNLTDDSYVLSFVSGEINIKNSKIFAKSDTHYAFRTMKSDDSAPVVTLWHNEEHYDVTDEVVYTNTVTGLVEYTGGSVLGNTEAGLEVVAKKSFEAVSGELGSREGWGTISTPVYTTGTSVLIPDADVVSGEHDIYKYDEPTSNWLYYTGEDAHHPFGTFDLGQGYLYANTEDITLELRGTLANGISVDFKFSYNQTLSNGELNQLAGFNFIGNPYLCNIALKHLNLRDSGFEMANGFYRVTDAGALEVTYEYDPDEDYKDYIKPMESVMIQVKPVSSKSANLKGKLTILPYAETKRSEDNSGYLAINVEGANHSDIAYVSFNEGLGLNKINHRNSEIPMVYIPVDGEDFAIATMSQDVTEIPVSFKAAQMGEYTIGVEARDCEYGAMTLVDRMTGIETNLLLEDYSFLAKSGDNSERFIIRLANDAGNDADNDNFAYINNGMMYIYNIKGQGVVNVYDITGRPVAEYNVAESASISTADFVTGMYIIRMSDENGVKVQKIIVE